MEVVAVASRDYEASQEIRARLLQSARNDDQARDAAAFRCRQEERCQRYRATHTRFRGYNSKSHFCALFELRRFTGVFVGTLSWRSLWKAYNDGDAQQLIGLSPEMAATSLVARNFALQVDIFGCVQPHPPSSLPTM